MLLGFFLDFFFFGKIHDAIAKKSKSVKVQKVFR